MTIAEAVIHGAQKLRSSDIVQPEREAESLLRFVIAKDRAFVVAHPDAILSEDEIQTFERLTDRRSQHEPFQYIVGIQDFFGLEFSVTTSVLIPRPETEILVEAVIKEFQSKEDLRFCEIGVGSGCVSIAILVNLPRTVAVGVDVSAKALEVARANAERHDVSGRIKLYESNLFDGIDETDLDMIVSNPPYVPDPDLPALQQEVRDFEPRIALSGGRDGLAVIRKIIEGSPAKLRAGGMLFVEIGWDQAESVRSLFYSDAWLPVQILPDLQGIPRIVVAKLC